MHNLLQRLMAGGSTAALVTAFSFSAAQAQSSSSGDIEQVVVSASRISIAGYQAPTPVTVVSAAALEEESHVDLGDTIRELPALNGAGNGSPQQGTASSGISGAGSGQSTLALRGLGVLRTLVLFDGQRVVQSNITGGVDLDTIPTDLVSRVDIVTGGASAAWGSDAVAGVVNLVLNKNFTGLKANMEYSNNYNSTYPDFTTTGTWGTDFDGGRGHVIVSGSFVDAPDAVFTGQAHWNQGEYVVLNSPQATAAGGPTYIHATNVGQSQTAPGGLILSNPAGTAGPSTKNLLANITFSGPNGTPIPINPGVVSGGLAYGGDLNFYTSEMPYNEIAEPLRSKTLFLYGRYKITDNIQASLQINYGHSWEEDEGQTANKLTGITINSGNAYIPASVQAAMTQNGITQFTVGFGSINNYNPHDISFQTDAQTFGMPVNNNYHTMTRGVFTLEGSIGDDWSWNAYYQHGMMRIAERVENNALTNNITQAAQAVTVTLANRGASGLPVGSIACQSTLTNPTDGCHPLDIFGTTVMSQAAAAFIESSQPDWINYIINEDVLSGAMQGTLPWGLPAGKVATSFGAEYRKEAGNIVSDPRGATNGLNLWTSGNFPALSGEDYDYEGFVEVDAPILKNDFVESLDANAAGRITSYSYSGMVETWKLGLTSQVDDNIRLRLTWSTDIRAPDLSELFTRAQVNIATAIDPATGLNTGDESVVSGNPNLVPEVAHTITGGVVLSPQFIPGLNVSVDWYSISIHNSITTPSATVVDQQCIAGNKLYCGEIIEGSPASNGLLVVGSHPVNAASETTSGLDFQLDYPMDFYNGTLTWQVLSNYNDEHSIIVPGISSCDGAGMAGQNAACVGQPKFSGKAAATYVAGPWSVTAQTRFTGAWVLNNTWKDGVNIDNNDLPWKAFLDLRGSYKWNDYMQIYGAIDDVTNEPTLVVPPFYTGSPYLAVGFQSDSLGRIFRAGVRFNFD